MIKLWPALNSCNQRWPTLTIHDQLLPTVPSCDQALNNSDQISNRPSKSEFFCALRILYLELCAKKCAKNAIKTDYFFYFVRMRQKHKNSACSTSFALNCLNFTQILENFAQSCDFTTSTFRSSDLKSTDQPWKVLNWSSQLSTSLSSSQKILPVLNICDPLTTPMTSSQQLWPSIASSQQLWAAPNNSQYPPPWFWFVIFIQALIKFRAKTKYTG